MSLTPMLKQYNSIRHSLPEDTVLFFRLGDFYEMFYDDAKRASSLLDITLTARDGGTGSKVPMCGVPYHAAQGYINRLTRSGLKVAVCEQVEDPKSVKGIVRREVTRIISPGTNLEDDTRESGEFNYIASVHKTKSAWGCAFLDLGTGDFRLGQFDSAQQLEDELIRRAPRECVLADREDLSEIVHFFREHNPAVNHYDGWVFDREEARKKILEQFGLATLAGLGIEDMAAGISCAGALLYYLKDNLHTSLQHLKRPRAVRSTAGMLLDKQTIRNLELIQPAGFDRGVPTLYSILNRTVTPMGARLLSQWIVAPLTQPSQIDQRLDAVDELSANNGILEEIRRRLRSVKDLERLLARINCGTPSARDIVALGSSLKAVPAIQQSVSRFESLLLKDQSSNLHALPELAGTIERAFVDMPPPGVRDGGFIREGFSAELDSLRNISLNAKDVIVELQKKEAEETGIKSLKIKFNKVFGYYIEVTRPNLHMVPEHYIRKQTLVNSERFIIPELKSCEEKILGAEERSKELEFELFEQMRLRVLDHIAEIQTTAIAIALLDTLASLALVAVHNNYCRPEISENRTVYISGGRHPVVEHSLDDEQFVDNDVLLDTEDNQLLIITGPNMAGKSTYIRQVALIVLMAQVGSCVPARMAKIGVVDRIFSRIGASDNLARGESTFMVEMIETAGILHNATPRSLLVFDEIGRGTSTFDGISIAWSVCEYLSREAFHPKCLFATHYHELTELADHRRGIKNLNVTVKEIEDNILFLRKVLPGSADRSYGIHVGKLAGLPLEIIERANEVLLCLEEEKISEQSITNILKKKKGSSSVYDLPLFKTAGCPPQETPPDRQAALPVIAEIKGLDVNAMTPVEAILKIAEWKDRLKDN